MREANYTNDDNYKVFNSHSNSMGIGKLTTAITIITQRNNIVWITFWKMFLQQMNDKNIDSQSEFTRL